VFAVTDNDSWEEWSGKIYPADPAYYNFTIKGASKEKYKIVDDVMTTYQFINVDGEWYYDVNADGEIDEAEMDKRDIESSYYYPEIIFLGDGRVAMQMEITLNYTEEDDVNTYYGWPAKGSLAINIFYTICMKQLLTVLPPVFLMFLRLFFINYRLIYFLFFFLVSFQYQKTKKRTLSTTKGSRVRFSFSYLFYSSNATRSVELVQV